jgi:hypothetical protein
VTDTKKIDPDMQLSDVADTDTAGGETRMYELEVARSPTAVLPAVVRFLNEGASAINILLFGPICKVTAAIVLDVSEPEDRRAEHPASFTDPAPSTAEYVAALDRAKEVHAIQVRAPREALRYIAEYVLTNRVSIVRTVFSSNAEREVYMRAVRIGCPDGTATLLGAPTYVYEGSEVAAGAPVVFLSRLPTLRTEGIHAALRLEVQDAFSG